MVLDPLRTPILEKAIHKIVKKGDVVFDLGCGLGVLSFMAIEAGAKKVYACDVDEAIDLACYRAKQQGMDHQITFFKGLSSEVFLPEKVDVILSETIGSLGFNENILPFLIDARNRFLKPGGKILPEHLSLFAAPLEENISNKRKKSFKKKKEMIETALRIQALTPKQLLAKAKLIHRAHFLKTQKIGFDQEVRFTADRKGKLTGFAGWFEVDWGEGFTTTTAPWNPMTHWKQTVLPNQKTTLVQKGDQISFRLRLLPHDDPFSTKPDIEWGYQVTLLR